MLREMCLDYINRGSSLGQLALKRTPNKYPSSSSFSLSSAVYQKDFQEIQNDFYKF
jgi:hypothetical protein